MRNIKLFKESAETETELEENKKGTDKSAKTPFLASQHQHSTDIPTYNLYIIDTNREPL